MAAKPYSEKQLSFMSINPAVKGRMVDSYPHLIEVLRKSECPDYIDSDTFIRFVAYVYDPQSPLIVQFQDLAQRKKYAESLTGFKVIQEHAQTVVRFLKDVISKRKWTVIMTKERMFEEFAERVNEPIATEKSIFIKDKEGGGETKTVDIDPEDVLKTVILKIKLAEEMDKLADSIPAMYDQYFHQDKALLDANLTPSRSPEEMANPVK